MSYLYLYVLSLLLDYKLLEDRGTSEIVFNPLHYLVTYSISVFQKLNHLLSSQKCYRAEILYKTYYSNYHQTTGHLVLPVESKQIRHSLQDVFLRSESIFTSLLFSQNFLNIQRLLLFINQDLYFAYNLYPKQVIPYYSQI